MDKEKIITIIIGLGVGIILAGGYFFGPKILPLLQQKKQLVMTPSPKAPASPSPQVVQTLTITLTKPEDNSSTTEESTVVSGNLKGAARVYIFAPSDEKIASTDAQGNFLEKIKLEEGENEISATIIGADEKLVFVKRNVTLEVAQ